MQACVLSSLRVEWVSSTWGTKKLIRYLESLLHQKPWKSVTGWGEGRLNLLERHYCIYKKCFRYNCFEDNIIWWQWLFISEYFILRLVTFPTTGKGASLGSISHNNIVMIQLYCHRKELEKKKGIAVFYSYVRKLMKSL